MGFGNIFNQVIVLFLIMLIGYGASKRGIIDKRVNKGLTELLMNITLPAMIIVSFNYSYSEEMLLKSMTLLGYSIVIHLTLTVFSKVIYFRYPDNMKGSARFMTIFSNCGFMGYPIIESVYGKEGVFYAAIFNIPFNILIWTIGVALFTNRKDLKNIKSIILNPGIVSVAIGLVFFVFSIKLPVPIYNTLDLVGRITTPLSMIVIGAMLGEISLKEIFIGKELYYASFIRLIVVPLAGLAIFKYFGVEGMLLGIPVLILAMPGAANTALIAEKYGSNSIFASRAVFLTTVLSLLTIPLVILFL
jgi:malate permease and related proteins